MELYTVTSGVLYDSYATLRGAQSDRPGNTLSCYVNNVKQKTGEKSFCIARKLKYGLKQGFF